MTSTDGHEMVQIQNGRIIFNWRALQDGEYPRWSSVEPSFQKAYDHLTNFAGREKLGDIKPNQWEVTYVNHLVRGREWRDLAECHSVVPGVIGRLSVTSMDTLDSIGADLHFGLPKQAGRLHVELNHGFASADEDASELLVLKLTARGSVSEENDHKAGLRLGRETIVRAFTDLTSDDAHAKWGRLS